MQRYVAACHLWGRNRFGSMDGVERLAELLDVVVQRVEPAGLPLFAGWHAFPLPDDAPARATQLLHVLREHRGGAHVMAVRTVGLSPLEAVIAGKQGAPNAKFFGWPEPYPEIDERLTSLRIEAERLTTEMELLRAAERQASESAA